MISIQRRTTVVVAAVACGTLALALLFWAEHLNRNTNGYRLQQAPARALLPGASMTDPPMVGETPATDLATEGGHPTGVAAVAAPGNPEEQAEEPEVQSVIGSCSDPVDALRRLQEWLASQGDSSLRPVIEREIDMLLTSPEGLRLVAGMILAADAETIGRLESLLQWRSSPTDPGIRVYVGSDRLDTEVLDAVDQVLAEVTSERARKALKFYQFGSDRFSAPEVAHEVAWNVLTNAELENSRSLECALNLLTAGGVARDEAVKSRIIELASRFNEPCGRTALRFLGAADPARAAQIYDSAMETGESGVLTVTLMSIARRLASHQYDVQDVSGLDVLERRLMTEGDILSRNGKEALLLILTGLPSREMAYNLAQAAAGTMTDMRDQEHFANFAGLIASGADQATLANAMLAWKE